MDPTSQGEFPAAQDYSGKLLVQRKRIRFRSSHLHTVGVRGTNQAAQSTFRDFHQLGLDIIKLKGLD
jgi:hypothetical protein